MSPEQAAITSALRALVGVSERLVSLAAWLREQRDVVAVRRSCWMNSEELQEDDVIRVGVGRDYRIEWFVEADFADGNGVSFGIDVFSRGAEWAIEASARSHSAYGEDVLVELPTRYATETEELSRELVSQVAMLDGRRVEALRLCRVG